MADLMTVMDNGLRAKVNRKTPKCALSRAVRLHELLAKQADLPYFRAAQGAEITPVEQMQHNIFYGFMTAWTHLHHAGRPKEAVIFTRLFAQLLRCDDEEPVELMLATLQIPRRGFSLPNWKDFSRFLARLERRKKLKRSRCLLHVAAAFQDVADDLTAGGYVELAEMWRSFKESMQLYADEHRDREFAELRRKDKLKAQRKLDLQAFDDFGPKWMERWLLEGLDEPPSAPAADAPPPPSKPQTWAYPPADMCPTRLFQWRRQRMFADRRAHPGENVYYDSLMHFAKQYRAEWDMTLRPTAENYAVFMEAVTKFGNENPEAYGETAIGLREMYKAGMQLEKDGRKDRGPASDGA